MALYEIVLRFPDRDEIRIADQNGYAPGAEVVLDNRRYVVAAIEPPQMPDASERILLLPADGAAPGDTVQ